MKDRNKEIQIERKKERQIERKKERQIERKKERTKERRENNKGREDRAYHGIQRMIYKNSNTYEAQFRETHKLSSQNT